MDQAVSVTPARAGDLEQLLRAVAAGDRQALKGLYQRTSARLYGICLRVLGDESDAQDALQEVFTTVWIKAGQFDPAKAGAITWMGTLARNRSIDRLRRGRPPNAPIDEAAEIAADEPSQLEVLESSEDASRLEHCLEALDERARTMIRAAFIDGASYPELAGRAAVRLPTMKSWIRRGLLQLRGCLEQ